jgi:hypothetical protein
MSHRVRRCVRACLFALLMSALPYAHATPNQPGSAPNTAGQQVDPVLIQ